MTRSLPDGRTLRVWFVEVAGWTGAIDDAHGVTLMRLDRVRHEIEDARAAVEIAAGVAPGEWVS